MKDKPQILRQGDTTPVLMEISKPLGTFKLKAGFYNPLGTPLFEAVYPDDRTITKIDDTHYELKIPYAISRKMQGAATFRAAVYTADLEFVNAGENAIPVVWEREPATRELK